jgi:hypothetical protein
MNRNQELIEILLEGRSDAFKAKVLEAVYRHQLDPDDPNLQIMIATGQLEVLLEEMPDRLQQIIDDLRSVVDHRARKPWVMSFKIDGSWQTAAFGWAIGVAFGCLGWLGGWHMKSSQVYQHYSPAELEYLDKLWQINSEKLLQCQQQQAVTCAIQMAPDRKTTPK